MFTLLIVVITYHGVTTSNINFPNESSCLASIPKVLELETKVITVKARCLKVSE